MSVTPALAADLFEPYGFEFFRNGTVVAVAAGALCGLLGVFVVLRGMSYIGHGLSHAVFGGAAASAVMNFNYFIGAGLWGIVSGVLIGRIARRRILGADAAIGVVTTASFAVGLALLNRYGQAKRSIEAVLFGSVLGVKNGDIVAVVVVGLLAAAVIIAHQAGGAAQALLDQLALAFIVSRVLYFICYLADWGPVRSLVWFAGMGLIVALFVVSA